MGKMQNIGNLFSDSKTRLIIILTFVFLGGAILIAMMSSSKHKVTGPSSTAVVQTGPGQITSVPFTTKATPEYERTLEAQNLKQAEVAQKTGGSAIPTITKASDFSKGMPESVDDVTRGSWQQGLGFTGLAQAQRLGNQHRDLPPGMICTPAPTSSGFTIGANGQVTGPDGKVLGTLGANGQIIGPDGKVVASIGANGQIMGPDGTVLGNIGNNGQIMGPDGKVLGTIGANGQIIGPDGKVLGKLGANGQILGPDGKVVGSIGANGQIIGADGRVIGSISNAPTLATTGKPVVGPDGQVVGTLNANGQVVGPDGKVIGTVGSDGQLVSPDGKVLGLVGPNGQLLASTLGQPAANNIAGQATVGGLPGQAAASSGTPSPDQRRQAMQQRQMDQINAQKQQQQTSQLQNSMAAQANQLFAAWGSPTQQYVAGSSAAAGAAGAAGAVAAGGSHGSGNASAIPNSGAPLVKAGTIMFAVLVTAVNTDEPGPVMAKIVDGPFKGGVLLGGLTPQNQKVMLSFNLLNMPSMPKSIPVNAVAIDENTARTGMSSYTNNHYVLRYGTLFASAFLQGYGQAVTNAGSTIQTSVVGNTQTMPNLSPKGEIVSALGNVGTKWGAVAANTFSTPPTVYVNSGTGMGILFMQDVQANS